MTKNFYLRWVSLEQWGNHVIARGRVYGNPKFFEGYSIHTSKIVEMSLEGTELMLLTQNSVYRCSLEEFCGPEEKRSEIVRLLKEFLPDLDETQIVWVEAPDLPKNRDVRQAVREGLVKIGTQLEGLQGLPNDCYILCIESRCSDDYFFSGFFRKTAEGAVQLLLNRPLVHTGRVQDSVLCLNESENQQEYFDLRYFPKTDGIKLYQAMWNVGHIYEPEEERHQVINYLVCNVGEFPISVNQTQLSHMEWYVVDESY